MSHNELSLSAEQLKSAFRNFFQRAYAEHDASVIDELCAPDIVQYGLGPEHLTLRDDFKKWYASFSSSFSEVTCEVTHFVIEGDWLSCRIRFKGKHTGPGLGLAATGKPVQLSALILARMHKNMVVECYNEFNQLALMQQIGAA